MSPPDRAACQALDDADPLAAYRDRFVLPEGVVYLDGNSLGPPLVGMAERLATVVTSQWAQDLVRSWNLHGWVDLPHRVGDRLARLLGAGDGTVVCGDSTTVNLYKAVAAGVTMAPEGRRAILTDDGNFPTDLYVMESVARRWGGELRRVPPDDVVDALSVGDVGVLALTHVDYRTGRLYDLDHLTAVAHAAGAVTVWDLSHSAGVMPIDLTAADADLAVGCGYKYLNGGPGAPAFLYVRPEIQPRFENPIAGWFGHARPFEFSPHFTPASGIARARVGTPHIVSMVALDAALDAFDGVDLADVRAKSMSLTSLFVELVDALGLEVVGPRDPRRRGSQVSIRHPDGYRIVQALAEGGVVGDFRAPDIMRFGFAPLYIRHVDAFDAAEALGEVMSSGVWRHPRFARRAKVT